MVKYKDSETESEGATHAPEPCFRVRVCMEQFYGAGDVRARAYVCVSPLRRVRWLARRLRRLFTLPRVRLLSRGHLLPPQEPLALLQPDDPVECVPAERSPRRCATEPADTADSVDEVQVAAVEEPQRSLSPVYPDDLTETKRQALLMLEQFCAEPAAERAADGAPRPRRRRVRRRRRVPPAAGSAGTDADDEPAPAPGSPAGAMVLRNDLQPRAARVVRPLADQMTASLRDTPPADLVMG